MTIKKFDPNWIAAIAAALALIASLYAGYVSNDKATSIATATVQAHEQDLEGRMDRLENKIDILVYYITGVKPGGK